MKAKIKNWEIKELGPAHETRVEHRDANGIVTAVTFDGRYEVNLKFIVTGNNATVEALLDTVRGSKGKQLAEITFGGAGRRYVFNE